MANSKLTSRILPATPIHLFLSTFTECHTFHQNSYILYHVFNYEGIVNGINKQKIHG